MDSTFPVWKAKDRNMTILFANIKRHALEKHEGRKTSKITASSTLWYQSNKKKVAKLFADFCIKFVNCIQPTSSLNLSVKGFFHSKHIWGNTYFLDLSERYYE